MLPILNDAQIEIAAKKYCELAGINPDKTVDAPTCVDESGQTFDVCMYELQWESIARIIKNQNLINQSINFAYTQQ